jgi:hypothetical protein
VLSSISSSNGQQMPPKMKLEENYKYRMPRCAISQLLPVATALTLEISPISRLYKLVSYMASLLYRKWIGSSDETTFRGSCNDQNGINVASRCDCFAYQPDARDCRSGVSLTVCCAALILRWIICSTTISMVRVCRVVIADCSSFLTRAFGSEIISVLRQAVPK